MSTILDLLEVAEYLNALQLRTYCIKYLAENYSLLLQEYSNVYSMLGPEIVHEIDKLREYYNSNRFNSKQSEFSYWMQRTQAKGHNDDNIYF